MKNNGPVITEALKKSGIPFVVTGLSNLFETDEARAARDLFYYIAGNAIGGEDPPTGGELRRSWENPRLGLAKRKLEIALGYAKDVHPTLCIPMMTTIRQVFRRYS